MECCLYPAKYTFSFNFSNYGIQSDLRKVPNLSAIVHQDIWRPCQKDALAAGHVRDSEIRQSVSLIYSLCERTCVALEEGRREDKKHFLIWRDSSVATSVNSLSGHRQMVSNFNFHWGRGMIVSAMNRLGSNNGAFLF